MEEEKEGTREIKYNGKEAYITEEEWRSLLHRFELDNAVYEEEYSTWIIKKECILCRKYAGHFCIKCPMYVFRRNLLSRGCLIFIQEAILGRQRLFHAGSNGISFDKGNERVCKQIKTIYDAIKSLPKMRKK